MRKILFDMDGTLAVWQNVSLETVTKRGYFASLEPMENVCTLLKGLVSLGYEVGILSSVFQDGHSSVDKIKWLMRCFGGVIDIDNVFFVPYGERKSDYIKANAPEWMSAMLIDDFSENLREWENAGGLAVKLYNGINGNHGTWLNKYSLSYDNDACTLLNIIEYIFYVEGSAA